MNVLSPCLRTLSPTILFFALTAFTEAQWIATPIPEAVETYSIATVGEQIFVGTDSALYFSSNGGTSWFHPPNLGLEAAGAVYSLAMNDSFLFAATDNQGVFRSADRGFTWEAVNTGLPPSQAFSLAVSDSGIFVGMYPGVFLSMNNGITWQPRNTGMHSHNVWELAIAHDGDGREILFAGGVGVFRSTNHGGSWVRVDSAWADISIWALAAGRDSNIYAGTDTAGVYYSSDMGETWVPRGLAKQSVQGIVVVPDTVEGIEKLLAGTFENGVFGSFDTGKTWFALNYGLLGLEINALAANSTDAFAGLWRGGVFRNLLHDMLDPVGEETGGPPADFALGQNYPNPFNPTTTIAFLLTERSTVTLVVSDILGRDVATLLDGRRMGPGRHEVPFDASGLASGFYLYRLESSDAGGGFDRRVRKMVVLR